MSSPGDDSRSKRYDRQIRIWGAEGQSRLEAARVLLLNCGPTGSETLKNLVLGGIAAFTVVDAARVSARDLGNNFFVAPESLGEPRAKVVTALLKEMNECVAGSYVETPPEALVEADPGFVDRFDLVVATQMTEPHLLHLESLCRSKGVKLLAVRSYGLAGYMRASMPEHTVIESKPDTQVDDLRLTRPWPALREFAASFNIEALDDGAHKHVPYVVLIQQALESWRRERGGAPPSTAAERAEFKRRLAGMRRVGPEGVPMEEENVDEALKAAFHAWTQPSIPPEVRRVLEDERASPAAADAHTPGDDFWLLAAALRAFVANEGGGCLPLEGSIPDMHATTDLYLRLQRVYRAEAEAHAAAVEAHAARMLAAAGRPGGGVAAGAARHFCRNARNLRVVRYRTLAEEVAPESARGEALAEALGEEGTAANASLYVLLRAADRFHSTHGSFPGVLEGEVEADMAALKGLAQQVVAEVGASGAAAADDYACEMCRLGAAELHVVAAVMGGMAAQEAIKLITRQFVPFGGTLIYNAITSTTSVLDL
ncbi:NEDD8-activating enzyme E1 regulatory subunit [Raphidocelis subcapitata]|uniref:NEDD8-activating enzyme E1 regulatory subunit n=1 Tax=Raphidocelis subcapitata TaxID=307507 RepID=A0A2V0NLZ2_9CHLO|nr:NEDD8-activating enzyme E1 regulatory subunit [Raphidocelis subcapitata]|eukprot:GBF88159.1 NEDD8-activating enzyme E1 regulatory subunit [Raphidocelis subcapitata]